MYRRPDLMHRILEVNADAGAVPEHADRGRRAGGDDLRQLGRRAGRRRLPGVQPGLHPARAGQLPASATASASRASSSPRAAVSGSTTRERPGLRRARPGLDHEPGQGARAHGSATGKALQGNLDPNVLFAPPEQVAARGHRRARELRHAAPTAGRPAHVFNLGHGISQHTRPRTSRCWSTRCTRTRACMRSAWNRDSPGEHRLFVSERRCGGRTVSSFLKISGNICKEKFSRPGATQV